MIFFVEYAGELKYSFFPLKLKIGEQNGPITNTQSKNENKERKKNSLKYSCQSSNVNCK
uniref:Uncharacterized protein n=1 Tax=Arundo donax TaxID=35708 RepID=A0A0A8XSP1_ARUDO